MDGIPMNETDNRLRIAFLTSEPAHDKHSHSGSLYYIGKALEQHCGEVTYVHVISWERRYLGRIMREAAKRHLVKWQIAYKRLLIVAKKEAKIAAQRLAGQRFDVIVAPDCAPQIAFLRTDIPTLLPLDVTFRLQRDYYTEQSNLLAFSARQGEIIEQAAFQNVSQLLFSSPWAARSAIEDYGIDPQKVHTIFWGANLDHIPPREQVLTKQLSGQCRLLFIGVDWQRKGGDIAYETLLKLEEMGIEAELVVCGTTPPPGVAHKRLTVIPYLDKNDEQQAREIEKLYAMSDFLILPTRADCVPNVFGEANAFGVPVITADTGGVADAVRDGENGYVLPFEARGEAYARVITELYRDEPRYRQLAQSSRAIFETYLNWDAWGMAIKNVLNEMLAAKNEMRRGYVPIVEQSFIPTEALW
jgi:glycosyltransferase involved in cell wall biosynthesis